MRIENLVLNVPGRRHEFGEFLDFETLTLCPIDTRCIERSLLRADEMAWLNAYHATVRERLAPRVSGDALAWLEARTAPIAAELRAPFVAAALAARPSSHACAARAQSASTSLSQEPVHAASPHEFALDATCTSSTLALAHGRPTSTTDTPDRATPLQSACSAQFGRARSHVRRMPRPALAHGRSGSRSADATPAPTLPTRSRGQSLTAASPSARDGAGRLATSAGRGAGSCG